MRIELDVDDVVGQNAAGDGNVPVFCVFDRGDEVMLLPFKCGELLFRDASAAMIVC